MAGERLLLFGAGSFGFIIGWYIYFINRYRGGDVQLSDLVTLIGILGGAAITRLFPSQSPLFGAYGIGVAAGFLTYFILLWLMVMVSSNFNVDWFLDGRRKKPTDDEVIPEWWRKDVAAMGGESGTKPPGR